MYLNYIKYIVLLLHIEEQVLKENNKLPPLFWFRKTASVNIRCFDARIYSLLFLLVLQILAQTMNSRTHEPREYRGNMMRADISTLTVT